jgi:transposase
VRQAREAWKVERQPKMRTEPHRLVFIDETGTILRQAQDEDDPRGRCDRGQRLRSKAPFGHWKTQTFVAGLRCGALTAPWVVDAPMDRAIFETYVRTQLVPTLQEGDIVILDNLGSHRGKGVRRLIRSAGAKLFFLPKYSPDLNPIEQVFSKLKHMLRKAQARSYDALLNTAGELLDTYNPAECANYLKNSGYGVV